MANEATQETLGSKARAIQGQPLNGKEIQELLVGNTLIFPQNRIFYTNNSMRRVKSKNRGEFEKEWSVSDDGKYCHVIQNGKKVCLDNILVEVLDNEIFFRMTLASGPKKGQEWKGRLAAGNQLNGDMRVANPGMSKPPQFAKIESAQSSNAMWRGRLPVPDSASRLTISFANPKLWDGDQFPVKMRCKPLGGENPASPALSVSEIPKNTASLVVFFANPSAYHNHGLVRVVRKGSTSFIPSIRSGASKKLPKGVEILGLGNTWGRAYTAPCPREGFNDYTVKVYALDIANTVLAVGTKNLGSIVE